MKAPTPPRQIIKAVYHLRHEMGLKATGRAVGKHVGISGPSVMKMVTGLAKKGLLKNEKYKGITLTPKGFLVAMRQVRCHRLWETFLYHHMGFGLMAIHLEAERLEYNTSEALMTSMAHKLGHPLFDPHGDPIPSETGVLPDVSEMIPLHQIPDGTTGMIARLSYQTEQFSQFCDKHGMNIGDEITVISKEPTGGINLKLGTEEIYATKATASQIYLFNQDNGHITQ